MKNIITLTGNLASGKGTISKLLQERLGYEIYRNGDYFRSLGKQMGMDVTTFNKYVEEHPEEHIDEKIEFSAKEYAKTHDNLIIDARLGYYVVPESFKVFVKVDIEEAARRAFNDQNRKDTENFNTLEEQKKDLITRRNDERERYLKTYNSDIDDLSQFDLIVDTTNISAEEATNIIIEEYQKRS